jgi:hypothetical protein
MLRMIGLWDGNSMIISSTYKELLQQGHLNPKWMKGQNALPSAIESFLIQYQATSMLDFGCSQGGLLRSVQERFPNIDVKGYDPGIPKFEVLPDQLFDVIVSTDVLEHIEPSCIDLTLETIGKKFSKACYLIIASYPAKKKLADGRNAHLIIEGFDWWRDKLEKNIPCTIVHSTVTPVYKTPKKGPPIVGEEFCFVLDKR